MKKIKNMETAVSCIKYEMRSICALNLRLFKFLNFLILSKGFLPNKFPTTYITSIIAIYCLYLFKFNQIVHQICIKSIILPMHTFRATHFSLKIHAAEMISSAIKSKLVSKGSRKTRCVRLQYNRATCLWIRDMRHVGDLRFFCIHEILREEYTVELSSLLPENVRIRFS